MDELACIRQVLSLFLHGDCRGLSVAEGRAEISLLYCNFDYIDSMLFGGDYIYLYQEILIMVSND